MSTPTGIGTYCTKTPSTSWATCTRWCASAATTLPSSSGGQFFYRRPCSNQSLNLWPRSRSISLSCTLPTRMAPRSFQMSRRSGFSTRFRAHTGVACAGIGARLRKHCCATSYACTRVSLLSSTPRTSTSPSTSPTLMTRGTMSLSCGSRRSTSCRGRCRTPRA